jgi:hypothetical protein
MKVSPKLTLRPCEISTPAFPFRVRIPKISDFWGAAEAIRESVGGWGSAPTHAWNVRGRDGVPTYRAETRDAPTCENPELGNEETKPKASVSFGLPVDEQVHLSAL